MKNSQPDQNVWRVPGREFAAELGKRDESLLISLSGDIDIYTCPAVLSAIDQVTTGSTMDLVLDLKDVVFMDSCGISILIRTHKMLEACSRKLILDRISRPIDRVLSITGLTDILNIRKNDRNAIA